MQNPYGQQPWQPQDENNRTQQPTQRQEQHFQNHYQQPQQASQQHAPAFPTEQRDKWRQLVARLTKDKHTVDSLTMNTARWLEARKFTEAEMSAVISSSLSWSEMEDRLMTNRRRAKEMKSGPPSTKLYRP